ncbi:unnamed protein product [Schistosoma margrebowiei]|uniref:Uncharacterized protein n=1 Tax=Schistosoma margrebowiei TaxID=48269 RepID=A0A183MMV6_9TREM|nr:unnamed protein product [Schistosoma margrebowiei]
MVVAGSQQETLDPGFVLLGTRQQGVHVILRELVLPGGFDLFCVPIIVSLSGYLFYSINEFHGNDSIQVIRSDSCKV